MKIVAYTTDALKDLRRHANVATRIRRAIEEYAVNPAAHANNVTRLVGSSASRMRVGDFRVIFTESESELLVLRAGPRDSVYTEGT